eukprot:SAG25_NODE_837_length_5130_cov_15.754522_6_plen_78_part_00
MASGLSRRGRPEGSAASSHTRGQKGQPPAQQGQAGQKGHSRRLSRGRQAGIAAASSHTTHHHAPRAVPRCTRGTSVP